MSLHRRAARRDRNESPIVDALLAVGFSVKRISAKGLGDLLLGRNGITRLVEVKAGDAPMTPDQREFWQSWRGNPPIVLRSVDDVPVLVAYWALADVRTLALRLR